MKKTYIISFSIFALACLYLFSPIFIKSYVEKHYPAKIHKVSFGLGKIYFEHVHYGNNGNIYFKTVTVNYKGPIVIDGGWIHLTQNMSETSAVKHDTVHKNIIASHIDVSIKHGENYAEVKDAGFDGKNTIKFSSGFVSWQGQQAELIDGQVDINSLVATVKYINTNIILQKQLSKFGINNIFMLRDAAISFRDNSIYIDNVDIGTIKAKKVFISQDEDGPFVKATSVEINHELFSKGPAEINNIVLRAVGGDLNRFQVYLGSGVIINIDLVSKSLSGAGSCNQWVEALPAKPKALQDAMGAFSGDLTFDIKLDPPKIEFKNTCEFRCSSLPIKGLYSLNGYKYIAYDKDNKPFERMTGLYNGTDMVDEISPLLIKALVSLEDPSFYSHKGIVPFSLELSLRDDLKSGIFRRGGSTLTMQLAKNLWLTRDKTLLRKADEIFLALALESCLTKDQIIQYYLNVVEYGPNIYGIANAAQYYFKKLPDQLNNDEAYYLVMLLPHPKKTIPPNEGGLSIAHFFADKHITNQTKDDE